MIVYSKHDRALLKEAADILEEVERNYPKDPVVYTDTLSMTIKERNAGISHEIALFVMCTSIENILHEHAGKIN